MCVCVCVNAIKMVRTKHMYTYTIKAQHMSPKSVVGSAVYIQYRCMRTRARAYMYMYMHNVYIAIIILVYT